MVGQRPRRFKDDLRDAALIFDFLRKMINNLVEVLLMYTSLNSRVGNYSLMPSSDMPSSDMPSSDSWKEQLTLISGNILILGVALLKLWPLAARLQTSEN